MTAPSTTEADARWGRPRCGDWIQTNSGGKFRIAEPAPEDIDIRDIAHALANQCRFAGHVRKFYSVAEHSVRVARLLAGQGCDVAIQYEGLMHDASEAYLCDIARPIKRMPEFQFYRDAEDRLMAIIAGKFGFTHPMSPEVARADGMLVGTEARDLMAPVVEDWHLAYELLPGRIRPWSPATAKVRFLEAFHKLSPHRG